MFYLKTYIDSFCKLALFLWYPHIYSIILIYWYRPIFRIILALLFLYLNAVVMKVSDYNIVVSGHSSIVRPRKLRGVVSTRAKLVQQLPIALVHEHCAGLVIHNDDSTVVVHSHSFGSLQFSCSNLKYDGCVVSNNFAQAQKYLLTGRGEILSYLMPLSLLTVSSSKIF